MTEDQVVALFDQLQAEMVTRGMGMVRAAIEQHGGSAVFEAGDELLASSSVRAGVIATITVLVERKVLKFEDL